MDLILLGNNVFTAQQNAQAANAKVEQVKAEAQQKIAEAEGQAKAQKLLRVSIDKELLAKLWIEKWDGHLPQVQGNQALPMFDLKSLRDTAPSQSTEESDDK